MKRCSTSPVIRECKSKPQGDTTSHLSEWLLSKRLQVLGSMWRKGTPGALLVGMQKLVQPLWILQKLKIELPYDPAIPLLDIYPKEMKALSRRDSCILMFIAALSTITKVWKQPKCPSVDERIKRMWHSCTYNGILFSYIKGNPVICDSMKHGGYYPK